MQKNIFISAAILLSFQISHASIEAIGAVSTATGGSGRGAFESVDGIYLNPAFLRDFRQQNFSYNYAGNTWALSMTDTGEDSFFPAGIQMISHKNDFVDTQKMGLTLALPRWKTIAVGATASLVEYTDKTGVLTDTKFRQGVLDIGMTAGFGDDFSVGFAMNKVSSSHVEFNEGLQLQKTMGLGLSYRVTDFSRLRADVESAPEYKTDRLVYMLGLENFINEWVIFRVGFQNNKVLSKDYFTAGLGFAGPQFTLHYAYIADTSDQTDQKHLIDLGIPF